MQPQTWRRLDHLRPRTFPLDTHRPTFLARGGQAVPNTVPFLWAASMPHQEGGRRVDHRSATFWIFFFFKSTRYEHTRLSPSSTQSANAWFYSYDCQTVPITTLLAEPWGQCWPYSLWGGLKYVLLHVLHKPVVWQRTENRCNEEKATDTNLTGTCPIWPLSWAVPHVRSSSQSSCQWAQRTVHDTHGTWHPVQGNRDPTSLFCTRHRGVGDTATCFGRSWHGKHPKHSRRDKRLPSSPAWDTLTSPPSPVLLKIIQKSATYFFKNISSSEGSPPSLF